MATTGVPASEAAAGLGLAGSPAFLRAVGGLLVAAGLGLAAIRFVGASPMEDGLEGALGSFALGAPVMATGVLAWMSLHDRSALLAPAAIVLVPLSFLSFALVTLPLLVPAAMLAVGQHRRSEVVPSRRAALVSAVVVALLVAAVVALFVHLDPRDYTTASSSGSTSDVITTIEALISLALTTTALRAGWVLAARRP